MCKEQYVGIFPHHSKRILNLLLSSTKEQTIGNLHADLNSGKRYDILWIMKDLSCSQRHKLLKTMQIKHTSTASSSSLSQYVVLTPTLSPIFPTRLEPGGVTVFPQTVIFPLLKSYDATQSFLFLDWVKYSEFEFLVGGHD